jgi:RNA polymerase sigma-70 factor (ECF subfamily)
MRPHLGASYNLARWLLGNAQDAEDAVQDAYLRAFRFFPGRRGGGDGRPWLLTIVRRCCYDRLEQRRSAPSEAPFDEAIHSPDDRDGTIDAALIQKASAEALNRALDALPLEFKEVLVLRELEELSYKEIAAVAGIPIGTVMSRLARARPKLAERLRREGLGPGG